MDDILWQHLKTLPAFRALLRSVEARFYHQFETPSPVLDLGCGDGDFVNHTFNEFNRSITVGIDPWIGPLKKSVATDIYENGALQAVGNRMPFPSNHFGAIISNSVLEHIPHVTGVIVEAGRVLQQDGVFIMTMPNHRFTEMMWGALFFERLGLHNLANRYRQLFNFVSRHQHTEPVEWWAERLAQGGMVVDRWQYYFSPAALHTLEFGHVQGLPSAIVHLFTGKWILAPVWESLALTDRWVRPHFLEQADENGCYQFIVARKVSDGPIQVPELPEARPFEVLADGSLKPEGTSSSLTPAIAITPILEEASFVPVEPQRLPEEIFEEETSSVMPSVPATFGILSGLLCGLIAMFLTDDLGINRPWIAISFWVVSILSAFVGLSWSIDPRKLPNISSKLSPRKLAVPIGIFAAAWIVRAWNISEHPWILSGTEAAFGIEKLFVLMGARTNPFGTDAFTNPLLPIFLTSFTEWVSGRSVFALRWLSPIIGAATVAVTFIIGRKFWGTAAGLSSAILLLGNHTHVHYSRLGLTNIWDPLMMLLSIAAILYAWQREGRLAWLIAGLFSGLSFYFFTAGHLLPVLVPTLLLSFAVTRLSYSENEEKKSDRRSMLAGLALSFVVMLPQLAHYVRNSGRFFDRLSSQGVLQTNWIEYQGALRGISPAGVWFQQWFRSLAPLLPLGQDDLSPYYGASIGYLSLIPSLLFLVGLGVLVFTFRRPQNQMIFWSILVSVLGGGVILTFTPQSHRLLFLLPLASITGGLALQQVGQWLSSRFEFLEKSWILLGLALFAIASVVPDTAFYFGTWQESRSFTDRNTEIAFEIAGYLNQLPADSVVYLQAEPVMNAAFPTIGYMAPQFQRGRNIVDLPLMSGTPPELARQGATVFIMLPERVDELKLLTKTYPAGEKTEVSGFFADPLFTVYAVAE
ncbi:MAG: methyltransferase domain-containing protein [Chloroflexota bacterium]